MNFWNSVTFWLAKAAVPFLIFAGAIALGALAIFGLWVYAVVRHQIRRWTGR